MLISLSIPIWSPHSRAHQRSAFNSLMLLAWYHAKSHYETPVFFFFFSLHLSLSIKNYDVLRVAAACMCLRLKPTTVIPLEWCPWVIALAAKALRKQFFRFIRLFFRPALWMHRRSAGTLLPNCRKTLCFELFFKWKFLNSKMDCLNYMELLN